MSGDYLTVYHTNIKVTVRNLQNISWSVNRELLCPPLPSLLYVLTLYPMGQFLGSNEFLPIDVMLNSKVRRITSYRRDLLVNDPEKLCNHSHIQIKP